MKNPNPNMLLRIAQGDAFGVATEYIKREENPELYEKVLKFDQFYPHPTHDLKAGCYTDDTQMSIAVAEALIDQDITAEGFAQRFFDCFKRDQRDGYSRGFQAILEKSGTLDEMLSLIVPASDKNGAAMRSVPLGVISSSAECAKIAALQARITHDTPDGIFSSQAVALMSHFALHTDFPLWHPTLKAFIQASTSSAYDGAFSEKHSGPVTGPRVGLKTAQAVYTIISNPHITTLRGVLEQVIEWGGDTDSVAAIAMGIASTRMREPLPDFMEWGLETGKRYGVEYLKKLGSDLMDKFA